MWDTHQEVVKLQNREPPVSAVNVPAAQPHPTCPHPTAGLPATSGCFLEVNKEPDFYLSQCHLISVETDPKKCSNRSGLHSDYVHD